MKRSMVWTFAALGLLAGCGTSPEPDYYTLAPISGSVSNEATCSVEIQRPFLPGYLDSPNMVRQDEVYQVRIDETHRWAEPLDRMFERILAEDLRQRLPMATITAEDDSASSGSHMAMMLNVQKFNSTGEGLASLQAQLALYDKATHKQLASRGVQYTTTTGSSAAAMAEGLSALTGKLADETAIFLRGQTCKDRQGMPPYPEPDDEK